MEEIFVPALGMAMEEATLIEWIKAPGDRVEPGDPVAEIETDKSTLELAATTAGTLGIHRAEPGAVVEVGATIAVVLAEGESEAVPTTQPMADAGPREPVPPSPSPAVATAAPAGADGPRHRLSPRQRMLAAQGSPAKAEPTSGGAGMREAIARLVSRAWAEIPHFAVAREVDADGVLDRVRAEPPGVVRVSVTDVLARALARSIAKRGLVSDIGLAVATPDGVVLPVLPDVAGRTLPEIAQLRYDAVERARARRSTDADTHKPAVTLSNLGTHDVSWFTGIIPLGQQGLLTTGTIEQRPVVRGGRLDVGWCLDAILNVDHRVWDGAEAAELLAAFAGDIAAYGAGDDDH